MLLGVQALSPLTDLSDHHRETGSLENPTGHSVIIAGCQILLWNYEEVTVQSSGLNTLWCSLTKTEVPPIPPKAS